MRAAIAAGAVALALLLAAGCGGSGHPAATVTRTVTAAPASPAPTLPPMTHAEESQDCAALALVRTGVGTYAEELQTMAGQYDVPRHVAAAMIARDVRDYCPDDASVLP